MHRVLLRVLTAAMVLAGTLPSLFAVTPESVLNPQRVAELRAVTGAWASPDGRWVAFTRAVPRRPGVDDDGDPWTELWLLTVADGTERPFITGKVNLAQVQWTPDSRHLAFVAKRGDDKVRSLYFIPVDGGEARQALSLKGDIEAYSLASDGRRVALLSAGPEPETRKKLREKGFKQEIFEEDWRPSQVWVGRAFDPAAAPAAPIAVTGSVRSVRWSPVDDRLALSVTPTPSVDDGLMRQQVVIVDGASTNGTVLGRVEHAGKLEEIAWSPDGRHLALIAGEDLHDPSAGRLLVAASTGGAVRDLLPGLLADVQQVVWVDATRLRVVVAQGVLTSLLEVSVGGGPVRTLHGPAHPVVTGLSLSQDGRLMALVASTPRHPNEVFTATADEPSPLRRRTDSNPWLNDLSFARQEVVRHRARDGLELEGILIRPLEEKPGERYPLILTVHGGPESHVSDGWLTSYSLPGQVAAARGFAVFYPNYRGSTGRGVAFSKLGQADAAGKEFDDLVDAVDHLIETGLVDRARVGVTGGSYGGYATAWCSTRYSERFAAGVMFVGISDKISKVGTTDIADEEYLVHGRKRPWEAWQFLLERSPIYHAGNSRTPLLILHGADDPRVHPSQSKEMYRHMKLRSQAPVRLVFYPGEGHGNRKAAARYDYHLRMLQWFGQYLQGTGGPMPASDLEYGLPAPTP